jgi:hypothetical protein
MRIKIYKVRKIDSPIWIGEGPLNSKIEFGKENSKLDVYRLKLNFFRV